MLTIDTDQLFLPKQYIDNASFIWKTSRKGGKDNTNNVNNKQSSSGTSQTSEAGSSSQSQSVPRFRNGRRCCSM